MIFFFWIPLIHKNRDSKLVWYLSPLRLEVESFGGSNMIEWFNNLRGKYKDPLWWDIFWSILWGMWLRRNWWVFDGKRKEIDDLIHKAISIVGDYDPGKLFAAVQRN